MNRERRLAEQMIERYPGVFGTDNDVNKAKFDELAITNSKQLRNKIVGKITRIMKVAARPKATEEAEAKPEKEAEPVPPEK